MKLLMFELASSGKTVLVNPECIEAVLPTDETSDGKPISFIRMKSGDLRVLGDHTLIGTRLTTVMI